MALELEFICIFAHDAQRYVAQHQSIMHTPLFIFCCPNYVCSVSVSCSPVCRTIVWLRLRQVTSTSTFRRIMSSMTNGRSFIQGESVRGWCDQRHKGLECIRDESPQESGAELDIAYLFGLFPRSPRGEGFSLIAVRQPVHPIGFSCRWWRCRSTTVRRGTIWNCTAGIWHTLHGAKLEGCACVSVGVSFHSIRNLKLAK